MQHDIFAIWFSIVSHFKVYFSKKKEKNQETLFAVEKYKGMYKYVHACAKFLIKNVDKKLFIFGKVAFVFK